MSLNIYTLNQKYNYLASKIGQGGGGGDVENPMTSNLDGGGFDITNVGTFSGTTGNLSTGNITNVVSTNLQAVDFNDTSTPSYVNIGTLAPGQQYEIARISDATIAEGDITFHLRALDNALKHELLVNVIAYRDRAVIRILNNVSESDTLIFQNIKYGTDAGGIVNNLVFTCGSPSATCEITYYQNQADKGSGSYGSFFEPATISTVIPAFVTTYTEIDIELNTAGTTGNFDIKQNVEANTGQVGDLDVTSLGSIIPTNAIAMQSDFDMNNNQITDANTVETTRTNTDQLFSRTGGNIRVGNAIDFGANALLNGGGDDLNIQDNLDMNGNDINELASLQGTTGNAISVASNLDINQNDLLDVDLLEVDTINKATGAGTINFGNAISMTNNRIQSVATPVSANDATNKSYVDGIAGGGVQNPMTVDLDGGGFNITNLNSITTTVGGSNTFGNATQFNGNATVSANLTHDTGAFNGNGTSYSFFPTSSFNIVNNNNFSSDLIYTPGAQFSLSNNAQFDCQAGIFKLKESISGVSNDKEIAILRANNGSADGDFLQMRSNNWGTPSPMVISPSFSNWRFGIDNVATGDGGVPFGPAPNVWVTAQNGSRITLYDLDYARENGYTAGTNNTGALRTPYAGYITGYFIKSPAPWTFQPGTGLQLYINNVAVGSLITNTANITERLAQASWIYFGQGTSFQGGLVELELVIPSGSINTNGNNCVEGTKFGIIHIPIS